MELDILGVGSVIWVYDRRSADWNSWQLFDDVTELRDEDGELLKKAWVSPAYGREMSSMGLQNFSDGKPITVLREVGTK
ncbi:MAG TPA: hypothetical protein VNA32_00290 [Actinomycetota bacterium]|nr:hypothetical protein [Actinomycetota bacterium]